MTKTPVCNFGDCDLFEICDLVIAILSHSAGKWPRSSDMAGVVTNAALESFHRSPALLRVPAAEPPGACCWPLPVLRRRVWWRLLPRCPGSGSSQGRWVPAWASGAALFVSAAGASESESAGGASRSLTISMTGETSTSDESCCARAAGAGRADRLRRGFSAATSAVRPHRVTSTKVVSSTHSPAWFFRRSLTAKPTSHTAVSLGVYRNSIFVVMLPIRITRL